MQTAACLADCLKSAELNETIRNLLYEVVSLLNSDVAIYDVI